MIRQKLKIRQKFYSWLSILHIVNPMLYICIPWCNKYTHSVENFFGNPDLKLKPSDVKAIFLESGLKVNPYSVKPIFK